MKLNLLSKYSFRHGILHAFITDSYIGLLMISSILCLTLRYRWNSEMFEVWKTMAAG